MTRWRRLRDEKRLRAEGDIELLRHDERIRRSDGVARFDLFGGDDSANRLDDGMVRFDLAGLLDDGVEYRYGDALNLVALTSGL
jgi:hypothetical protein